jgi:hypothetical protein
MIAHNGNVPWAAATYLAPPASGGNTKRLHAWYAGIITLVMLA